MRFLLTVLLLGAATIPAANDALSPEDANVVLTIQKAQYRATTNYQRARADMLQAQNELNGLNSQMTEELNRLRAKYKKPLCDVSDDMRWVCAQPAEAREGVTVTPNK